jgi:HEAT repeat protein
MQGHTADLIDQLNHAEKEVRWAAVRGLARTGRAAVPALVHALEHASPLTREYAATALGEIGPDAGLAVPALIKALQDSDEEVVESVALALGALGEAARDAVPALIEAFQDEDAIAGRYAILALGNMGEPAAAAVPVLVNALGCNNTEFHERAAWALGNIGPAAVKAVPALSKLLESDDCGVLDQAAWALGRIGPAAAAAVPALSKLLNSAEEHVRESAIEALVVISLHQASCVPGGIGQALDTAAMPDVIVESRSELRAFGPFHPSLARKRPESLQQMLHLAELVRDWPTDQDEVPAVCDALPPAQRRDNGAKEIGNHFKALEALCGRLSKTVKHGLPKRLLPQAQIRERLAAGIAEIRKALAWHGWDRPRRR